MTQARSLLLVTVDCLRADRVGFLGHSGRTTPFLDSLAEQSFVFKNAIASGIPTYYSLPALLASRYPLALGRDVIGLAPGEDTIATELKECGFKTAAFIAANPYISAAYGYEQGFDVFEDFMHFAEPPAQIANDERARLREANRWLARACHRVPGLGTAYDEMYFRYCHTLGKSERGSFDDLRRFPSADVIASRAIGWIREHSSSPFFLWLHFMDPHAPYYPKEQALRELASDVTPDDAKYLNSYWGRGDLGMDRLRKKRSAVMSLYDAGIRWVDDQLQRVSATLRELKLWESCVLAVTADHGEEFLEHGGRFHAPIKLTEQLVHVPLLLRIPKIAGRALDEPMGLVDLAPTLLDVLEHPATASFRGRSCWRQLKNNLAWTRPVITECAYGCSNPLRSRQRVAPRLLAVRKERHKLVLNFGSGTDDLFDLGSDPEEMQPLPLLAAKDIRKELLEIARKHVAQSVKSCDGDLRFAAQVREFRERPAMTVSRPN
jgi:arylsulfatase A-like enzyme